MTILLKFTAKILKAHLIFLFPAPENATVTFNAVLWRWTEESDLVFTYKPRRMLIHTFLNVYLLLNTLFLLCFAVWVVIASATSILLRLLLEKCHSYFSFSFVTAVELLCILLVGGECLKRQLLTFRKHFNI